MTSVSQFLESNSFTSINKAHIEDNGAVISQYMVELLKRKETISSISVSTNVIYINVEQYNSNFKQNGNVMERNFGFTINGTGNLYLFDTLANLVAWKADMSSKNITSRGIPAYLGDTAANIIEHHLDISGNNDIVKVRIVDTLDNLKNNVLQTIQSYNTTSNPWKIYVGYFTAPETNKHIQGRLEDLTTYAALVARIYSNGNVYMTEEQSNKLSSFFIDSTFVNIRTDENSPNRITSIYPEDVVRMTVDEASAIETVFPDVTIVVRDDAIEFTTNVLTSYANNPKILGIEPNQNLILSKANYASFRYLVLNSNVSMVLKLSIAAALELFSTNSDVMNVNIGSEEEPEPVSTFTSSNLDSLALHTAQLGLIYPDGVVTATTSQAQSLEQFFYADNLITVSDLLSGLDSDSLSAFMTDLKIKNILIGTKTNPQPVMDLEDRLSELVYYFRNIQSFLGGNYSSSKKAIIKDTSEKINKSLPLLLTKSDSIASVQSTTPSNPVYVTVQQATNSATQIIFKDVLLYIVDTQAALENADSALYELFAYVFVSDSTHTIASLILNPTKITTFAQFVDGQVIAADPNVGVTTFLAGGYNPTNKATIKDTSTNINKQIEYLRFKSDSIFSITSSTPTIPIFITALSAVNFINYGILLSLNLTVVDTRSNLELVDPLYFAIKNKHLYDSFSTFIEPFDNDLTNIIEHPTTITTLDQFSSATPPQSFPTVSYSQYLNGNYSTGNKASVKETSANIQTRINTNFTEFLQSSSNIYLLQTSTPQIPIYLNCSQVGEMRAVGADYLFGYLHVILVDTQSALTQLNGQALSLLGRDLTYFYNKNVYVSDTSDTIQKLIAGTILLSSLTKFA
jgi:hypothetical protein